jgi:hypothetical protein
MLLNSKYSVLYFFIHVIFLKLARLPSSEEFLLTSLCGSSFDHYALELLERMLTLDPAKV